MKQVSNAVVQIRIGSDFRMLGRPTIEYTWTARNAAGRRCLSFALKLAIVWLSALNLNVCLYAQDSSPANTDVTAAASTKQALQLDRENEAKILALIADLESPKFAVRQNAAERLWEIGRPTEPFLYQALRSKNAEVVERAAIILKDFEYGIYSDTNPATIARIRHFRDGDLNQKTRVAKQLIGSQQVTSLVKLIKKEANLDTRRRISELLSARTFIRGYLENQKFDSAVECLADICTNAKELQITPFYFEALVADYLWLSIATGSLDRELSRINGLVQNDSDIYQKLLLVLTQRANGNYDLARKTTATFSKSLNRKTEIDLLLEQHRWKELSDLVWTDNQEEITEFDYLERSEAMNFHRLAGNKNRFRDELKKLIAFGDSVVSDLALPEDSGLFERVNNQVIYSIVEFLFVFGELDVATRYLEATDKMKAFEAYTSMFQYEDAFKAIGIQEISPATINELREQIRRFRPSPWSESVREITTYCTIVDALYQLGYYKESKQLYRTLFSVAARFESLNSLAMETVCEAMIDNEQFDLMFELIKPELTESNYQFAIQTLLYDRQQSFDSIPLAEYWWQVFKANRSESPIERLKLLKQFLRQRLPGEVGDNQSKSLISLVAERKNLKPIDYAFLGSTYLLFEQRGKAKTAFRKSLENQEFEIGVNLILGDLHREDGETTQAHDCYLASWEQPTSANPLNSEANIRNPLGLYLAGLLGKELSTKNELDRKSFSLEKANQQIKLARCFMSIGSQHNGVQAGLADRGFTEEADEICKTAMGTCKFRGWNLGNLRFGYLKRLKPSQGLTASKFVEGQLHDIATTTRYYTTMSSYSFYPYQSQLYRFDQLLSENKITEAHAALSSALKFRPSSAAIAEEYLPRLRKAEGGEKLADELFERIRKSYRDLLVKFPNSGLFNNNLAWVCTTNKKHLEEALKAAELVVANEPENATYLDTLADVCFNLGQITRAIELMEKCHRLDPTSEHYTQQLKRFRGPDADKRTDEP